ncbi:Uncharacterised protein [Vibrio cholerae]|nr:Uncharacterised protein [Vibrio cholerae]CSI09104.1 Uncharacterised protein [Vibrio cholerae]
MVSRLFNLIHNPMRFAIIDFTCSTDQLRFIWTTINDKPRINRNTVATDTRTWVKNTHTRMAVG